MMGNMHAVYLLKGDGDVATSMMITRAGSTGIELEWTPIPGSVYRAAISLEGPDETDAFAKKQIKDMNVMKYEAEMVA